MVELEMNRERSALSRNRPIDGPAELVFVYGTLRLGASNHHRMKGAEWIRSGVAGGRMYQVAWYPGFVPDDGGGEVVGEVYRVRPELLKALDEFEGLPAGELVGEEYERRKLRVGRAPRAEVWDKLPDEIEAWTWVWRQPTDTLQPIPSGDWLDFERPRRTAWFTALGCVGILAVPVGGVMLIALAGPFLPWFGNVRGGAVLVLFLAAGLLGIWAVWMGQRRREKGLALRILTAMASFLWIVGVLLMLVDWLF